MSLYDGLGIDTGSNQSKVKGWSPSFQMLKSQLQVRKANLTKAKTEKSRTTSVAPVIDFTKLHQDDNNSPLESLKEPPPPSVFLGGEVLEKYIDEYDPMRPNDYEKLTTRDFQSRENQKELDREKEIEERRKRRAARHAKKQQKEEEDAMAGLIGSYDPEADKRRAMAGKVAIAPPSALIEADMQSLPMSIPPTSDRPSSPTLRPGAGVQFASNLAGSVAHKIMSKYGFKEGRGLGKDNRGMSHALQVEKTSKRGGKIISSDQIEQKLEEEFPKEEPQQQSVTELLKNPTKNMVGPGEVDADLQTETSDECSKYGAVSGCLIYEMPHVPDDEAVRIFIEFERMETAIKALVDLNGRFFGGRTVKASFYDPVLYKDFQLAEPIP